MVKLTLLSVAIFLSLAFTSAIAQQDDSPAQESQGPQNQAPQGQNKDQQSERQAEESSSKDTRIDLSAPKDDVKNHPQSGVDLTDAGAADNDSDELHAWDPHKAAKDIEVGDFYFRRKNFRAALERYKDALTYKPNDAVANYRLAECQEKTGNAQEAAVHYQEYLKILPHGPLSGDAQKALDRLKQAKPQEQSSSR